MFLSVIIPIHNVERYLGECVESIIRQDFQDYELILVENASTDNSFELCKRYAEKYSNIKLIRTEIASVCNARNSGLQAADGDYIWFVDGDDTVAEGAMNIIRERIQSLGEIDMLIFNYNGNAPFERGGGKNCKST